MLTSVLRAAGLAAGIATWLTLAPGVQAQHCYLLNYDETGKAQSQSSGTVIGSRNGQSYILACWHGVQRPGGVSVQVHDASGRHLRSFPKESVAVIASDKGRNDLALLRITTNDPLPVLPVMPTSQKPIGKGVLWGFPRGTFSHTAGTMTDGGDLSFTVIGGNSGGPFVDSGCVTGVLVRYHGCTTVPTIQSFLKNNGHEWLLTNPVQRKETAVRTVPPRRKPVTDLDRLERAVGQVEKMSDRDRSDLLLHILRQLLEDDE